MTRNILSLVVFLAGLAVVGWIGTGYLGTNPLALAIILLIGLVYVIGAVELQRYQRGTNTLSGAVSGLTVAPSSLDSWLSQLHPSLRGATRLRIEGQRVALPGPGLTPYLVGLLVLLGMLGTFLGMVATLRGTGAALESAVDLQAIRASLAAPVQGLGFAFGTSVAGVATSAALGMLAALCRRSRVEAAQQLDVLIATTLRPYSQNHQGEQTYKLMQQQAEAMPVLVERLQAMMTAMEKQSQTLHERLAASQDAFYGKTEMAYTGLATAIEQSLKQSVMDSARVAGDAIQPAVQSTLAGLARETSAWQDTLAIAIRQQLESLSGRFEATTSSVADIWNQALAQQERTNAKLTEENQRVLIAATAGLEQHATSLLRSVDQSHTALQNKLAEHDQQRLDTWKGALDHIATGLNTSLESTISSLSAALEGTTSSLNTTLAGTTSSLSAALTDTASTLRQEWAQASTHATECQQTICDTLAKTAQELSSQTQAQARDTITEVSQLLHTVSEAPKAAASVIAELRQSHADLQAQLIAQDQQRLDNWKASLDHIASNWNTSLETTASALNTNLEATASTLHTSMENTASSLSASLAGTTSSLSTALTDTASTLRQEWAQASTHATERQQTICDTLAKTAQELSSQTQAQARDTITEVSQLLHTVSEAPKAAASVIAELRQSHADLQAQLIAQDQQRLDNWKASLDHIASTWNTSIETTANSLNASMEDTAASLSASLQGTTTTLSTTLENTASTLHNSFDDIASSLNVSLENTALTLRQEWEQASTQAALRQQEICDTLTQTAQELSTHTQTQARDTIAEVAQLVQTAAEAPRAAASVISELRQRLSDGMARDNELLEERGRLMETLSTLLDAVNHASTQQRDAVDALIANSSELFERVGSQFTNTAQTESVKLTDAAAHITGSAVEVASLGEAFGTAVQLFSQSNDKLVEHLERIETALDKSMARSDEQLAYYVAQAREVVDLSVMSQKQIIEDLQQLANQQASANSEAAS
ncbi:DUF802 domain-containing protein [Bordetella tumulicola]|uniref:DUF802 domain-containing protein n=1 Tax=Bordetella tumulicola TaxID=1649133 RepID=UPI0039EF16A6